MTDSHYVSSANYQIKELFLKLVKLDKHCAYLHKINKGKQIDGNYENIKHFLDPKYFWNQQFLEPHFFDLF